MEELGVICRQSHQSRHEDLSTGQPPAKPGFGCSPESPASLWQAKLPLTFAADGGRGKGSIHAGLSNRRSPEKCHTPYDTCGSGDISAPPALLCYWIQPLEDGNVLGQELTELQLGKPAIQGIPSGPRPPKTLTPRHTCPNRKLKRQPLGRPVIEISQGTSQQVLPDPSGHGVGGLLRYPVHFQMFLSIHLNFCVNATVRALSSENPCHLHSFLASTVRWFDLSNDALGSPQGCGFQQKAGSLVS